MNWKSWILPVLSGLFAADAVFAAPLYENDFEALGTLISAAPSVPAGSGI